MGEQLFGIDRFNQIQIKTSQGCIRSFVCARAKFDHGGARVLVDLTRDPPAAGDMFCQLVVHDPHAR
jgi:hypothetical protein